MGTEKSYMVIICYFELYPTVPPKKKWLICTPAISAVPENDVLKILPNFYCTLII